MSFPTTSVAGAPVSISIAGGDAQSTVVDGQLAQPLAVIVRDASGNPVGGVTVTFAAPGGAAPTTLLPALQAVTASDGLAMQSARAGTITGAHEIEASIPGASDVFHLTNLAGAPAVVRASPASSPQSATILTPFAALLEVTVEDRFGNACPGADVEFAVPSAGATAVLSNASTTTDASGRAHAQAAATSASGAYLVTASVGGVADPAAFALTNLAGAPTTIVADGGSGQSAVVGSAFAAPIAARVLDAMGNPVPNVTVTFAVPQGLRSAILAATSVVTDADGRASTALEASTRVGTYTVTAAIPNGAAPASFVLTNVHDVAASITAQPSSTPQSATVAAPYAAPLAVTVRDRFANPVPGAAVAYAAPAGAPSGTLSAPSATTDATGRASVTIVAGTAAGAFAVTATTPGVTAPAQFALSNLSGAARSIGVRRGSGRRTAVTTAFATSLTVFVQDELGNPVPSAPVSFAAPATGATAQLSAASIATDAAGEASVIATAATIAGPFDVVATTPGCAAPAVFSLTATAGAPAAAAAFATSTPQATQALRAFAAPLVVIVVDAFGNRVPGVGLDLTVPDTGASATLSISAPATGEDGTASVLAVANDIAGAYDVVTAVEGLATPVVFSLTNTAGAPHSLAIVSGGGQHAMATTAFAHPLVVRVHDALGNPVPDATLALAMPTSGPSAVPSPGTRMTSDGAGRIEVALVANGHPGSFAVAASVTGAGVPAQLTMTIDAIPTALAVSVPAELPIDAELVATVAVTSAILVPTGDVEILDATATVIATGRLDATGTARVVLPAPSRGVRTYRARYGAQGAFAASSSATATVVVLDDATGRDGGGCSTGGGSAAGLMLVLVALIRTAWPRPSSRRRRHAPSGCPASCPGRGAGR